MPFHILRDDDDSLEVDLILDFSFSDKQHSLSSSKKKNIQTYSIQIDKITDDWNKISSSYKAGLSKVLSQGKRIALIPFTNEEKDINLAKEAIIDVLEKEPGLDITLIVNKTKDSLPTMEDIHSFLDEEKLLICHLNEDEILQKKEKRIFRPRVLRTIQTYSLKDDKDQEIPKEDITFSNKLFEYIKERDMTSHDFYKAVNIDRKLFSKMQSKDYAPSKKTALACCIALRLNEEESKDLLSYAGYTFSRSDNADCIILYCIKKGTYDCMLIDQIMEMNGVDQKYYFFN